MIRYCPVCWAENIYEADVCAVCGADLRETDKTFFDRLIDAVGHPEPTRATLACDILGRLGDARAIEALIARLARDPDSMDVTTAAAEALGRIGDDLAAPALAAVLLYSHRPLPARVAAAEALIAVGGPVAADALQAALALPHVPVLLRRVIESATVGINLP